MKFGIIVCPKCKKVKGINLKYKSTKCNKCNKIIIIKDTIILYKTDFQSDLSKKIGLINANLDNNIDKYLKIIKKSK